MCQTLARRWGCPPGTDRLRPGLVVAASHRGQHGGEEPLRKRDAWDHDLPSHPHSPAAMLWAALGGTRSGPLWAERKERTVLRERQIPSYVESNYTSYFGSAPTPPPPTSSPLSPHLPAPNSFVSIDSGVRLSELESQGGGWGSDPEKKTGSELG